jgi:uncharacterized protein YqfA (UPF0365 family)
VIAVPVIFSAVKMEIVIFRLAAAIKIHLLHLVGILFPHIIDDARSKPHQKILFCLTETNKFIVSIDLNRLVLA